MFVKRGICGLGLEVPLFYEKITPKYWITLEISELEKILV